MKVFSLNTWASTSVMTWRLWISACHLKILSSFYSCILESILTSCVTAWQTPAEKIIRVPWPSLQDIYQQRVHRRSLQYHTPQVFHTCALLHEVQQCEMQDFQAEGQLLSSGHQTNQLIQSSVPPLTHLTIQEASEVRGTCFNRAYDKKTLWIWLERCLKCFFFYLNTDVEFFHFCHKPVSQWELDQPISSALCIVEIWELCELL